MTFGSLVVRNVGGKKVRLAVTALAIAIGVVAVVSLGVVTSSLEKSDLALLQLGRADFTISQKSVADLLSSNIDQGAIPAIAAEHGVAAVTGVLVNTMSLNDSNPLFLEVGIQPRDLATFGVSVLSGSAFPLSATNEIMLGWRAAQNLGLTVGGRLRIGSVSYHVVGIYRTGLALGDSGAMFPLPVLQTLQNQNNEVTLLFVRAAPGANISALQAKINRDNPELVTVRTVEEFAQADRSLTLIRAAQRGSTVLAIVVGAVVVMSAMTLTFVERFREFGVLSAVGWSRRRILALILGECLVMGLVGAAAGLALSVVAVVAVQHLATLAGVLHPQFNVSDFVPALLTAGAMCLLGGLYPAIRAARTAPLEALRHE